MVEKRNSSGGGGFSKVKRIVVKVGTSNLTDEKSRLDLKKIKKLAREVNALKKHGKDVVLVTSGAIGAGIGKMNLKQRPRDIPLLQATAAVGQNILMRAYESCFREYRITVAQVLLTREDFFDRKRYLNARNTFLTLLELGVLPIVNENDTIAVDEIKFGDNDNLSAMVACSIDADLLVLLSDIDGLYTWDPRKSKKAELIKEVREITPEIEALAGKPTSKGLGGMVTKIQAAKITSNSGIVMAIVDGREKDILQKIILKGAESGTVFLPKCKLTDRERWIMFASTVKGRIRVDDGAKNALTNRRVSLLPSGIVGVEGVFDVGDIVSITDVRGREFAKGIVNYSCSEVDKIKGMQTKDIEKILGYKDYNEVIYSGNIVLTELKEK